MLRSVVTSNNNNKCLSRSEVLLITKNKNVQYSSTSHHTRSTLSACTVVLQNRKMGAVVLQYYGSSTSYARDPNYLTNDRPIISFYNCATNTVVPGRLVPYWTVQFFSRFPSFVLKIGKSPKNLFLCIFPISSNSVALHKTKISCDLPS